MLDAHIIGNVLFSLFLFNTFMDLYDWVVDKVKENKIDPEAEDYLNSVLESMKNDSSKRKEKKED